MKQWIWRAEIALIGTLTLIALGQGFWNAGLKVWGWLH